MLSKKFTNKARKPSLISPIVKVDYKNHQHFLRRFSRLFEGFELEEAERRQFRRLITSYKEGSELSMTDKVFEGFDVVAFLEIFVLQATLDQKKLTQEFNTRYVKVKKQHVDIPKKLLELCDIACSENQVSDELRIEFAYWLSRMPDAAMVDPELAAKLVSRQCQECHSANCFNNAHSQSFYYVDEHADEKDGQLIHLLTLIEKIRESIEEYLAYSKEIKAYVEEEALNHKLHKKYIGPYDTNRGMVQHLITGRVASLRKLYFVLTRDKGYSGYDDSQKKYHRFLHFVQAYCNTLIKHTQRNINQLKKTEKDNKALSWYQLPSDCSERNIATINQWNKNEAFKVSVKSALNDLNLELDSH